MNRTDDLYRVLSEPTPKAERDAVIRAAWREQQAEHGIIGYLKRLVSRLPKFRDKD